MADLVRNGLISQSGSLYVSQKKKPITIQQRFKTGREALITSSPIFNTNGNLTMIVTNVRDLTEIYKLKNVVQEKTRALERLRLELAHVKNAEESQDLIMKDDTALVALLLANRVAPLDTPVLLLGETGVGKEVLAHYIYQHSLRTKQSFIKVNSQKTLLKANCLATKAVLLQEQIAMAKSGFLNWPARGRSFWMKWVNYQKTCKSNSCEPCKNKKSCILAARNLFTLIRVSLLQQISI